MTSSKAKRKPSAWKRKTTKQCKDCGSPIYCYPQTRKCDICGGTLSMVRSR